MDAELAKKALKNASLNVKKTEGIILQTDLGSQYTSNIFEYIEAWYNRERIHSCLNYRTPDEVYSNLEKSLVA